MQKTGPIDIATVIDNSKIGIFQVRLFVLCGLCLIMDGFDLQAMAYVAPSLTREWHIPSAALGPVFSSALFGILVGSVLLSALADKIGRRPVLIATTFCFSILTILTARASSTGELLLLRFLAGVALGSIMPNSIALVGEYSPRRIRVTVMVLVATGFTSGGAIGGFVSAWLIPHFGWRSVFYFGGAAPLLVAVLMYFLLPESLQFLAVRGRDHDKIARLVRQLGPGAASSEGTLYTAGEREHKGVPIVRLFRAGRAQATVLLWIINFMNLLNLYFLASWLPTVVKDAGYSTSQAVLVGTTLQLAGTVGALLLSWCAQRSSFVSVLAPGFACACISIALIGRPGLSLPWIFVTVFIAGFCVLGGQTSLNALAATYYPTALRSTGVGSSLGIGRIGAIVGPFIGGELMARQWPTSQLFIAAAAPALISAAGMLVLKVAMRPKHAKPAHAHVRP